MDYDFLRLSTALRIASTSARSWGRPDASLAAIRSSLEMKTAVSPGSIDASTRRCQADSKPTPGISVRISTAAGARPIWRKGPGSAKSAGVNSPRGAPNCGSAAYTALAFSWSGLTQISRSLVARGCAWIDTACAPTTRYLTLWAFKADKSSLKSESIRCGALHFILLSGQLRHCGYSFCDGATLPVSVFLRLNLI